MTDPIIARWCTMDTDTVLAQEGCREPWMLGTSQVQVHLLLPLVLYWKGSDAELATLFWKTWVDTDFLQ